MTLGYDGYEVAGRLVKVTLGDFSFLLSYLDDVIAEAVCC